MEIRPFAPGDTEAVVSLWQRCELTRPWNNPHADIGRKAKAQPHLFLVGEEGGEIIATVMAGFDGHRGWLNYLGVDPDQRRRGLGRQLVEAAVLALEQEGCPKINLQIRDTNRDAIAFYQSIGFKPDPVLSMSRRLVDDEG